MVQIAQFSYTGSIPVLLTLSQVGKNTIHNPINTPNLRFYGYHLPQSEVSAQRFRFHKSVVTFISSLCQQRRTLIQQVKACKTTNWCVCSRRFFVRGIMNPCCGVRHSEVLQYLLTQRTRVMITNRKSMLSKTTGCLIATDTTFGESSSGKTQDFDSCIRRFDSYFPSFLLAFAK